MSCMTKEEIDAFNLALKEIDEQINFLADHFSKKLNGYSTQRLYAASRAMRDAVIDGET